MVEVWTELGSMLGRGELDNQDSEKETCFIKRESMSEGPNSRIGIRKWQITTKQYPCTLDSVPDRSGLAREYCCDEMSRTTLQQTPP